MLCHSIIGKRLQKGHAKRKHLHLGRLEERRSRYSFDTKKEEAELDLHGEGKVFPRREGKKKKEVSQIERVQNSAPIGEGRAPGRWGKRSLYHDEQGPASGYDKIGEKVSFHGRRRFKEKESIEEGHSFPPERVERIEDRKTVLLKEGRRKRLGHKREKERAAKGRLFLEGRYQ